MRHQSKEFKKLQKVWARKLKQSGFDDIEQDEDTLKNWASTYFRGKHHGFYFSESLIFHSAKEEYYRLATHFLNDHEFENPINRVIWQMHSEGKSIRDIVKHLSKLRIKIARNKVHYTCQNLAKIMLEKYREEDAKE